MVKKKMKATLPPQLLKQYVRKIAPYILTDSLLFYMIWIAEASLVRLLTVLKMLTVQEMKRTKKTEGCVCF